MGIFDVVMFERVRPKTIAVVDEGVVYTVIAVLAAVLPPVFVLSLKVFAMVYPSAIAKAVASSTVAAPVV